MPSAEITKSMDISTFQAQVSRLGKKGVVPHAKEGVNSQGEAVLFLRIPTLKDKLKDLLLSKERQKNADLVVNWLENACRRSGIDPDDEPVKDVKKSLTSSDGQFQTQFENLVSTERLGNQKRRRQSLV